MEDLRWILLGLGALVLLGLYLFSRGRRNEAALPLGDAPSHDPLETSTPTRRDETPPIEELAGLGDEGVGPVHRRVLAEEAAPTPRPFQPRPSRFGYAGRSPTPTQPAGISAKPKASAKPVTGETVSEPPPVVPLYLVARQPQGFAGAALVEILARYGFEFGEMDVYHYIDAHGHKLFSLINGIVPGTFDPATLPKQSTPALALFLRLPILNQPDLVFEQFLDLAHRLAEELDATLLDEHREPLTTESIDRMREKALGE